MASKDIGRETPLARFVLYGDHNKDLTANAIRLAGNEGVAKGTLVERLDVEATPCFLNNGF